MRPCSPDHFQQMYTSDPYNTSKGGEGNAISYSVGARRSPGSRSQGRWQHQGNGKLQGLLPILALRHRRRSAVQQLQEHRPPGRMFTPECPHVLTLHRRVGARRIPSGSCGRQAQKSVLEHVPVEHLSFATNLCNEREVFLFP